MANLTSKEPEHDYKGEVRRGSVEVSLKSMQNRTGVKIARKLLVLKGRLERFGDQAANV